MKGVVTFGEILGRFSPDGALRLRQSTPGALNFTAAGAEANVAVSLAQFGVPVRLVSALPQHPISDACVGFYAGMGVETSHILRQDYGRLGLYFYENGVNQRAGQVIYDRAHSTISLTPGHHYDWASIFAGAGALYLTGITPGLSETAALATIQAAKEAQQRGLRVFCDLNFRRKLWQWRDGTTAADLAREVMPDVIAQTDVLIANDGSVADIFGLKSEGSQMEASLAASTFIRHRFPGLTHTAMTMRENVSASHNRWGALLQDEKGASHFAPLKNGEYCPYEITAIIDRVGAGDAFGAGLVYALETPELSSPEKAIAFATAASCLCHSVVGDVNYASRGEVEALMLGSGSGQVLR